MANNKPLTILVAMVLSLGLLLPTYSPASAKETDSKDQVEVVNQIPQQTPVKVSATEETAITAEGEAENLVAAKISSELAIVGVTWSKTVSETPQVKYRTWGEDQVWSQWQDIDAEKGESEQRASGTEPIVVAEASKVQVQATIPDGSTVEGLKVTVINPGVGAGDSQANPNKGFARLRSVEDARGVAIHSRSDWGVDEKLMTWPPKPIKPQGVAIHHTAGTNNYSAAQVPGILRGIYYFHAVTRNWGDIGYNVLVDKYGRAWQGRRGTFQNPSEGAHARSVNKVTFGISVLGTYETQAPPWAAQDTVTRLAAAQLKLRGVNPLGTFTFRGHTFNRISGHRDFVVLGTGNNTACPGNAFYRQLGAIRQRAATLAAGWASGSSSASDNQSPQIARPDVSRLGGKDRVETSVAIARHAYPNSPKVVYLASALTLADAMAAGSLRDGPVVLTYSNYLPGVVKQYLSQVNPEKVVALGGTGVIQPQVLQQAKVSNQTLGRLAGSTRIETAIEIAKYVYPQGSSRVYVTDGFGGTGKLGPDAIPGAALHDGPILFGSRSSGLTASTRDMISRLGAKEVVQLGYNKLGSFKPTRYLAGADRFATSVAISNEVLKTDVHIGYLANGFSLVDGVAAGVLGDGSILLTMREELPYSVCEHIRTSKITKVVALGGEGAVSQPILKIANSFAANKSKKCVPSALRPVG